MNTLFWSVLIVLGVLLLFAVALLIFRTFLYGRLPEKVELPAADLAVEGDLVAEHLATAVRLQTISHAEKEHTDYRPFTRLHAALEKMYPRLHATLQREVVNQYSLLYTWPGREPGLDAVLLYGHLDVVPADPATLTEWTHPPFSGIIADGSMWGRGVLDMKGSVITLCEAVEGLIKVGYQPERTLYLAFGHDEEIGGLDGARAIAGLLEARGVRLAALCDEGGSIMQDVIPGVQLPVALIGIAEKGYVTLELKVEGRPGHSSMPSSHTAIGVLSRAIARIEANPMPARLSMIKLMFDEIGVFMPFSNRLAMANTWLFGGVLRRRLETAPTTNAQIRTTAAATMIHGGLKDNVLPAQVSAAVNCRLLPGDTRAKLLEWMRKVIDDEAVQISLREEASWEASPITPVDSPEYAALAHTVRQVFPDTLVAPFLMVGATDSRHFLPLTSNIFRFSPSQLNNELMRGIHGIDEHVTIDSLAKMVLFYTQLIKTLTTASRASA